MEYNELYHWGVKGQRWGFRRYQNADGSLTDEGREHYGYNKKRERGHLVQIIRSKRQAKVEAKKKKKQAQARAKALEAARKAKAEKKAHEEAKKKALESGTAEDILKYKNELTIQEKRDAYSRLNAENDLARLADEDRRRAAEAAQRNSKWNKVKRAIGTAEDVSKAVNRGVGVYNTAAKIINSLSDENLPILGEQGKAKTASMVKAEKAISRYSDLSKAELNDLLDELENMQKLEKYARGENAGGKKSGKKGNKN